MAKAVRQISIQRGYDVTRYVLACFGGAGGQHACLVADALGMTEVMIHPFAGVLSAYGMGLADLRTLREATVERPLAEATSQSGHRQVGLAGEAEARCAAQDVPLARVETLASLLVKYAGTDTPLRVPFGEAASRARGLRGAAPTALRLRRAEHRPGGRGLGGRGGRPRRRRGRARSDDSAQARPEPLATLTVRMAGAEHARRSSTAPPCRSAAWWRGPAIVREATGTTVIEPGWRAVVDPHLNLILDRVAALAPRQAAGTKADPVMLEVFNNLFMAVAEEMGFALQNTAYSVNIKERLDFSCALFDRDGANLIANAPHMPVHLGSMGDSVRAIRDGRLHDGRGLKPGDVYMLERPLQRRHPPAGRHGGHAGVRRGGRTDLLRRRARPPGRYRRDHPGLDAAEQPHGRGGGGADRELPAGRGRAVPGSRGAGPAGLGSLAGPQSRPEHRRPQGPGGGLRARRRGPARHGRRVRPGRGRGLYGHVQDNAEEAVRRVLATLADGDFAYELDDGAIA